MPQELVEELDDDISEEDLESCYSLHLMRGVSVCSSISAATAFVSLFDEVIEEWIDDDGNVYIVEEYCTTSAFLESDHAVTPCECGGQSSSALDKEEEETRDHNNETNCLNHQEGPDLGPEHSNLDNNEPQGDTNKPRKTTKQNETRQCAKKKHRRPSFLVPSSLRRLSWSLRKPKQITNAAA